MNILLTAINAKYIHSNLAVYSLKAVAGAYADQVELAEYTINHQEEEIFRSVYQKKPDLLFLSCYIWNRCEVLALAENIHKVLPETVIWAGGPEVSYDAQEFLQENPAFSGVMIGEGEQTFSKVLAYYVDGEGKLDEIPGIAYRWSAEEKKCSSEKVAGCGENCEDRKKYGTESVEVRVTAPQQSTRTLDDLPFVYGDLEQFENRIIYYETSRGCPFSCSYCLSSIDKKVRFRSLDLVFAELGFFLEHRVKQVKFVDRTFNCSHAHAMAIWKFIQEHDNGVTNFHFEIAADLLNEEELELLAKMRPGLVQLEIGVQTVNEQSLEAIHRTAKFEKITERVNKVAEAANIHQHLDLIAGLPYEDFESFQHSFNEVYSLRPQELQLGFLKVLRGSEMHRRAEEYGIIYRSRPPYEVLATRWISCDELLRLKEVEEMLEVYYNSQQFRNTMEALVSNYYQGAGKNISEGQETGENTSDLPSGAFALYEAMADYYKQNGLEGKSYSRMQRFDILRSFIREAIREDRIAGEKVSGVCAQETLADRQERIEKYYDELLTLDLYLRENAKSRPAWAADLSEYQRAAVLFYQQEEQEQRYLQAGYEGMNWKQMMRMTHLERFTDEAGEPVWKLFDYQKRDSLTGDASVYTVELQTAG